MQISVKTCGAVGDGLTDDTAAVRRAIAACAAAGGGDVVFDNGRYLCGALPLLDGVHLAIGRGAVVKASPRLADFDRLPLPSCDVGERLGFIYAIGRRDVGITGEGTIDLSGGAFFRGAGRMPFPGQQEPLTAAQAAEATLAVMPRLNQPILFYDCENVRLTDVRIVDSPCWTATVSLCRRVTVRGVTIDNSLIIPNSDGMGFTLSEDVTVSDCVISCADDCLTFCGTKRAAVQNCILRSRSSAVRIGYIAGETRQLVLQNLVIHDSNRAFIFQGSRGSQIRDVLISGVNMHTRLFHGAWWGQGEPLTMVTSGDGSICGVTVAEVRAVCAHGIALYAHEPGRIADVTLHDWTLTVTGEGSRPDTAFLDFRDEKTVPLPPARMPWGYAEGVTGLTVRNMDVRAADEAEVWDISPIWDISHTATQQEDTAWQER